MSFKTSFEKSIAINCIGKYLSADSLLRFFHPEIQIQELW